MNEEEIRDRVRAALTEALLPRDLPKLVSGGSQERCLMETGSARGRTGQPCQAGYAFPARSAG
jgi:hypothetical protein